MTHYVNSESIFSVIGDYPVVDQYDVLYSNLAAGSTYDNYITGSLLRYSTNFFTGKTTIVSGERRLVFSKLSVSGEQLPSYAISSIGEASRSYNLQPWRERAGIIRNVRIFCNDERYFDSFVPSLYDMYRFNGGNLSNFYRSPGGFSLAVDLSAAAGTLTGQMRMFPFEPIFNKAKRMKRPNDGFKTTDAKLATQKLKLLPRMFDKITGYPYVSGGDPYIDTNADGDINKVDIPPGLTESDAAKVLFGFGDLYDIPATGGYAGIGYNYLPTFRSGSWPVGNGIAHFNGPIIRGWRYGLLDGMPHYTSCVFRRDKFGQHRDMLEQRLNTVLVSDEDNSPVNYFGDVETPATPPVKAEKSFFTQTTQNKAQIFQTTFTLDSPIKVGFVKQRIYAGRPGAGDRLVHENEIPINTWSSNLSQYATSSLPYFDGVSRNRTPIDIAPNAVVVTTLYDSFNRSSII